MFMFLGPRTTNHAESWHASLRFKFHSTPHMKLGHFMVEFQENIHNAEQIRIQQLLAGHPPRPRSQKYIQNDARISTALDNFFQQRQALYQELYAAAENHVTYCGYLVGFYD